MKVLVINSGSSSLKYEFFDLNTETSLMSGAVSRIGMERAELSCAYSGKESLMHIEAPDHLTAVGLILKTITGVNGVSVKSIAEIGAVAHRI